MQVLLKNATGSKPSNQFDQNNGLLIGHLSFENILFLLQTLSKMQLIQS